MADYYKAISMLEAMKQYYSDDIKSNFDQAIAALRRCENIDKAEIIRMPKIVIRDKGYDSFEYPFGICIMIICILMVTISIIETCRMEKVLIMRLVTMKL